jgi:SAM-dependent methyltransferase
MDLMKDCIEWDVYNWSKAFRYWENHMEFSEKLNCLDIGGRNGGLSLWLALQGCRVICSDLEGPSEKAFTLHKKWDVDKLIHYEKIDATKIPYTNQFDIIAFKSVLGGVGSYNNYEAQKTMISQIYLALKPGGYLLYAENLTSSVLHQFLRRKVNHWGERWRYVSVDEIEELMSCFKSNVYDTKGFLGAFGRSEFQRKLFGKIDTFISDWLFTKEMKYIIFGIAQK